TLYTPFTFSHHPAPPDFHTLSLHDALPISEAEVRKWLIVLARCFELHDAVGVLELDRVLDASPDELDRHRLGLKSARRDRLELRSEEHTSELQSRENLVCRLLLEKKNKHMT